jgi:hypothetical protein
LAIVLYGGFGLIYGMFIGFAALIYIPLLLIGIAKFGRSLPAILLISNAIPLCFVAFALLHCISGTCNIYGIYQLTKLLYGGANFCGIVYWLIAGRRRSHPDSTTFQSLRDRGDLCSPKDEI